MKLKELVLAIDAIKKIAFSQELKASTMFRNKNIIEKISKILDNYNETREKVLDKHKIIKEHSLIIEKKILSDKEYCKLLKENNIKILNANIEINELLDSEIDEIKKIELTDNEIDAIKILNMNDLILLENFIEISEVKK